MGMHCTHRGIKPVFTIGSCQVHGGRETDVLREAGRFQVVISLLGRMRATPSRFHISQGARRVFANLSAYQQRRNNILCIDWPDMEAPDLDRQFWESLVLDLKNVQGDAAIFCMGGHGRTGTALSALIQVSGYEPALASGDVIQWVRYTYCQDAVETSSQVDYLRTVLGVRTQNAPSRFRGSHREFGGIFGPNPSPFGFAKEFEDDVEDYRGH